VLVAKCLTLMMALQMVTMPFTMAMKQLVMAETRELKQDATAPIVAVLCGLFWVGVVDWVVELKLACGMWLALE